MTLHYGLIGHPLGHSLSPQIHKKLFELDGIDADYNLYDIPPEELNAENPVFSRLCGFNVTIPHKIDIIPLLGRLSGKAALYRTVNCVKIEKDGTKTGFNTDALGFCESIKMLGTDLCGDVLLLGCGGAGRMMAFETALAGGTLTIAVRTQSFEKAEILKNDIINEVPDADISVVPLDAINGTFNICLNSTPVGMSPNTENSPLKNNTLRNISCLFDAVYNPSKTMLMRKAEAEGVKVLGGMAMLVLQAAASHEIWNGCSYKSEDISGLISEMRTML